MTFDIELGDCPYCGSSDSNSAGFSYSMDGTRQPAFRCKDCGHTFSYASYSSKRASEIRTDELLSSLITYGMIEQIGETFVITSKGHGAIQAQKRGNDYYLDDILLNTPLWKDLVKRNPLHPTKEMFFSALTSMMQDEIAGTAKEVLWHRYNTEVLPALERKNNRPGIRGLQGITLITAGGRR